MIPSLCSHAIIDHFKNGPTTWLFYAGEQPDDGSPHSRFLWTTPSVAAILMASPEARVARLFTRRGFFSWYAAYSHPTLSEFVPLIHCLLNVFPSISALMD